MEYNSKAITEAFLKGIMTGSQETHLVDTRNMPLSLEAWMEAGEPKIWRYIETYKMDGEYISVFHEYSKDTNAMLIHTSGLVIQFEERIDWGMHTFENTQSPERRVRVMTVCKPLPPPIV